MNGNMARVDRMRSLAGSFEDVLQSLVEPSLRSLAGVNGHDQSFY